MVDRYQSAALKTRLGIPMIYGIDAVHGTGNVYGATLFPHNEGMGATRDPALVKQRGEITAQEVRATGIPWDFAPCLCVTRDERWGRSYESLRRGPGAGAEDGDRDRRPPGQHRRRPQEPEPRAGHRQALRG